MTSKVRDGAIEGNGKSAGNADSEACAALSRCIGMSVDGCNVCFLTSLSTFATLVFNTLVFNIHYVAIVP